MRLIDDYLLSGRHFLPFSQSLSCWHGGGAWRHCLPAEASFVAVTHLFPPLQSLSPAHFVALRTHVFRLVHSSQSAQSSLDEHHDEARTHTEPSTFVLAHFLPSAQLT